MCGNLYTVLNQTEILKSTLKVLIVTNGGKCYDHFVNVHTIDVFTNACGYTGIQPESYIRKCKREHPNDHKYLGGFKSYVIELFYIVANPVAF